MDEQTAKNQKENGTRKSLNKQDSLVLKIVLIAFLILLSFIPMSMIRGLINEMEMTAEEAFQSLAPKMGRPNDKEIKAKEFLLEMLKDGEMLSSDCEERLEAAGFKKSTIKKAKKKAGVISKKKGFLWYWSLPMGDIPRE